jgi:hypothetical protein
MDASGLNAMSKGRAFGLERRWSIGSIWKVDVGRRYPAVESAGVSGECGGEANANIVVYSYLAYSCALKDMVAKFIRAASAAAKGLCGVVEDR